MMRVNANFAIAFFSTQLYAQSALTITVNIAIKNSMLKLILVLLAAKSPRPEK